MDKFLAWTGKYARSADGSVYKFGKIDHCANFAGYAVKNLDYAVAENARLPSDVGFGVHHVTYSTMTGLTEITREEFYAALARAIHRVARVQAKRNDPFQLPWKPTEFRRQTLIMMLKEVRGDV